MRLKRGSFVVMGSQAYKVSRMGISRGGDALCMLRNEVMETRIEPLSAVCVGAEKADRFMRVEKNTVGGKI